MSNRFIDRADAGRALVRRLLQMHLREPIVVLALPRGGVPIGAQVARALKAPLDLVLVRKIGTPGQPELALAAVAEGDPPALVIDDEVNRSVTVDASYIDKQAQLALREIARRRQVYLRGRAAAEVEGRTVIVVDDGIATGATAEAAILVLKARGAAKVVLAVPVASPEAIALLRKAADEVIVVDAPRRLGSVGAWYHDFSEVTDDQVLLLL